MPSSRPGWQPATDVTSTEPPSRHVAIAAAKYALILQAVQLSGQRGAGVPSTSRMVTLLDGASIISMVDVKAVAMRCSASHLDRW